MANDALNRSYTTIAHNERAAAEFDRKQQYHLPKPPHERRMHLDTPAKAETVSDAGAERQLDLVRRTVLETFEPRGSRPVIDRERIAGYVRHISLIGAHLDVYRNKYLEN